MSVAMVIVPQPTEVNYTPGRGGHDPVAIVDHVMEGTMAGTLSWFRNPAAKVSAHYGVAKSGLVVQYVGVEDTAWHAGLKVRPTAPLVLERGGNPNQYTIGIEHEGRATETAPAAQVEASAQLHAFLAERHGIPLDRRHVILHREIRADKTCPGRFPADRVVEMARALLKPAVVADRPKIGERRFSAYLGEPIILTRYESDRDWSFVRTSHLKGLGQPGTVPWSDLPLV